MTVDRRSFLSGFAAFVPTSAALALGRFGEEPERPLQAGDPLYVHGNSLMPYPRRDATFVSSDGVEAVVEMPDGTVRRVEVAEELPLDAATSRWNESFDGLR